MRKKRVCVVSAYAYIKEYINYGSLLQYYALEKCLKKMDYEPYWLRYRIENEKKWKDKVKRKIKILFNVKGEKRKSNILYDFSEFIKENLSVSEHEYYSEEELERNIPEADYYITGSDQVWAACNPVNYLCFAPNEKRKISYAASFGKAEISDDHLMTIKPWLKKFDYISVREKSGVNICNMIGVNAECVVDPTLLLNKEEYPYSEKYKNQKYVLCYFLNIQNEKDFPSEIIRNSAIDKNVKVVAGVNQRDDFVQSEYLEYFSPEDWLGAYNYADCIFTNSFHGTVFALIFHKPFIVFFQKGKSKKQNERMLSLLQMLNLEDRIYDEDNGIDKILENEIDWEKIDDILKKKKINSIKFLKKSCEYEEIKR